VVGCQVLSHNNSWFIDTSAIVNPEVRLDTDYVFARISPDSWIVDCILKRRGQGDIVISHNAPYVGPIERGVWEIHPLSTPFYDLSAISNTAFHISTSNVQQKARLRMDFLRFVPNCGGFGLAPVRAWDSGSRLTAGAYSHLIVPFVGRKKCSWSVKCLSASTDALTYNIVTAHWYDQAGGNQVILDTLTTGNVAKNDVVTVTIDETETEADFMNLFIKSQGASSTQFVATAMVH